MQTTWDLIVQFFKEPAQKGMTLISTIADYKNQDSKLTAFCDDCQENFKKTWQSFRAGHRCNSKTCLSRRKKASANKKYDIPMITDMVLADGDGDLLVSLEYVNYTSSLEFYCHICNDIYDKDLCHWLRGERCTCTVPNTKFTIGYIKQYMSGKFPHRFPAGMRRPDGPARSTG